MAILGKNYPDPFSNKTKIPYSVNSENQGQIIIKDILGKTVKVIDIEEGENKIKLDTKEWRSGTYIYTMEVEGLKLFSRKMVLSR